MSNPELAAGLSNANFSQQHLDNQVQQIYLGNNTMTPQQQYNINKELLDKYYLQLGGPAIKYPQYASMISPGVTGFSDTFEQTIASKIDQIPKEDQKILDSDNADSNSINHALVEAYLQQILEHKQENKQNNNNDNNQKQKGTDIQTQHAELNNKINEAKLDKTNLQLDLANHQIVNINNTLNKVVKEGIKKPVKSKILKPIGDYNGQNKNENELSSLNTEIDSRPVLFKSDKKPMTNKFEDDLTEYNTETTNKVLKYDNQFSLKNNLIDTAGDHSNSDQSKSNNKNKNKSIKHKSQLKSTKSQTLSPSISKMAHEFSSASQLQQENERLKKLNNVLKEKLLEFSHHDKDAFKHKNQDKEKDSNSLMTYLFGQYRFKSKSLMNKMSKMNKLQLEKIFYKNHPTYSNDSKDMNNLLNFTPKELEMLRQIQRRRKESESIASLSDEMRFKSQSNKKLKKHKEPVQEVPIEYDIDKINDMLAHGQAVAVPKNELNELMKNLDYSRMSDRIIRTYDYE